MPRWNNPNCGFQKGFKHSEETKKKISKRLKGQHHSSVTEFKKGIYQGYGFQKGHKHWNWKNGKMKVNEYIYILQPNHPFCNCQGYVFEHRLIIEQQIGRPLLPKEKCHHLNEIKDDNRSKNLMAFTNESAHQRFHKNPNNVKSKEIIFDGRKL